MTHTVPVRPAVFLLGSLLVGSFLGCGDEVSPLGDAGPVSDAEAPTDAGTGSADVGPADMGPSDMGDPVDMGPADSGATMSPFTTLRTQGPSDQRIDLVFVGDGYTQADLESAYTQHVAHVAGRMFTRRSRAATEPFYQFRAFFNVHRVNLVSNASGIDDPMTGAMVDTALDGTTGCGGLDGCIPTVDTAKARAAVDAALMGSDLDADLIIVTLNTSAPLENAVVDANGRFAIYGGGPTDDEDVNTSERGLRQIARALAGLGLGEGGSGAYSGPEPTEPNLTTSSTGAKWSPWVGFNPPNDGLGAVRAFEGGGGFATGIYRPTMQSKLAGDFPGPYDAVAREAIIRAMFDIVPAVTLQTPNSGTLMNPELIDVIQPIPLVNIRWFVNGMDTMIDGGRIGFVTYAMLNGLAPGPYTVEARYSVQSRFRYPDCFRCMSTTQDFIRRPSPTMTGTVTYNVVYNP